MWVSVRFYYLWRVKSIDALSSYDIVHVSIHRLDLMVREDCICCGVDWIQGNCMLSLFNAD